MRKIVLFLLFISVVVSSYSQVKKKWITGMYFQWGYNTEWYTNSNIHFKMSNGNDFTIHHAKALDKKDFQDIIKEPSQISIPQYNYRIGFYLNKSKTRALEINFDHAKYVVTDGQLVHVTGKIDGKPVNGDSVINPATFLHFEHTDGANWLHFNYMQQNTLALNNAHTRPLVTFLWKAGAGINIPRTDFTWRGDRLNNAFHVAGYNISAEAGARLYGTHKLFLEFTGKSGYVKYINALVCTNAEKGNRANHSFGYFELVGTIGYDINFR